MKNPSAVISQENETFEVLEPVCLGRAEQMGRGVPGMLEWVFDNANQPKKKVTFDWISSVLYVDELLNDPNNFPYAYRGQYRAGLYECLGSSYLRRLRSEDNITGGSFRRHRHFVYWDEEFSWHITCQGITIVDD